MVPYHRRMAVQSYMGLVAALAGSIGPLVGGWLADKFSWRWCFCTLSFLMSLHCGSGREMAEEADINVPTCIVALIMLKLFLRLQPPAADTRHLRKSFDFMGLYVSSFWLDT
jgi:MFS family permease